MMIALSRPAARRAMCRSLRRSVRTRAVRLLPLLAAFVVMLTPSPPAGGDGVSGTGIYGNISKLRSIVLNGVHYHTTNAVVRVNGELAELYDLRVGQQVYALVDEDTRQVLEVDQYDAVSGRIDEIEVEDEALAAVVLKIAGQTVRTGLETVVHVDDLLKLKKGDYLTVGGLRDESGVIHASAVEAGDKQEVLVTGLVEDLGDATFRIGEATVSSPYLLEIADEDWFYEGAPVQVRSFERYEDDAIVADSIIPVPEELVLWSEIWEYADMRLDGTIDSYDPLTGSLEVDGLSATLDERSIMHDRRDDLYYFGLHDVYPGDQVALALEPSGNGLHVKKLVRFKKVKPLLHAPLQRLDGDGRTLTVMGHPLEVVDAAHEVKFRGKKMKAEDFRNLVEAGDRIEIEWKSDGKVKRLEAFPDCRSGLGALVRNVLPEGATKEQRKALKEELKALKKSLKERGDRLYYCF